MYNLLKHSQTQLFTHIIALTSKYVPNLKSWCQKQPQNLKKIAASFNLSQPRKIEINSFFKSLGTSSDPFLLKLSSVAKLRVRRTLSGMRTLTSTVTLIITLGDWNYRIQMFRFIPNYNYVLVLLKYLMTSIVAIMGIKCLCLTDKYQLVWLLSFDQNHHNIGCIMMYWYLHVCATVKQGNLQSTYQFYNCTSPQPDASFILLSSQWMNLQKSFHISNYFMLPD